MLLSLLKHGTAKQEPPSDITRMVFERVRGGESKYVCERDQLRYFISTHAQTDAD